MQTQTTLLTCSPLSIESRNDITNLTEVLQYGTDADCRALLNLIVDELGSDTISDLRDQIETLESEKADAELKQLKWWSDSLGWIELEITLEHARQGHHRGQCDADIADLRNQFYIRAQLAYLSPAVVAESLKEYGAWEDEELQDHDANLSRLLWVACGDIVAQGD